MTFDVFDQFDTRILRARSLDNNLAIFISILKESKEKTGTKQTYKEGSKNI